MSRITVAKMPSTVNLYIPRMLGSVRRETVYNAFAQLNIGKVISLDMHRKTNENKNVYFFAFVKVRLFKSFPAAEMLAHLNEFKNMKMVYNEDNMQYWEVKTHVPRSSRSPSNRSSDASSSTVDSASDEDIPVSESDRTASPTPLPNVAQPKYYDMWASGPLVLSDQIYYTNLRTLASLITLSSRFN